MTNEERKFLIPVKNGKPKWDILGLTGVEDLPAVKWKLMNMVLLQFSCRKPDRFST